MPDNMDQPAPMQALTLERHHRSWDKTSPKADPVKISKNPTPLQEYRDTQRRLSGSEEGTEIGKDEGNAGNGGGESGGSGGSSLRPFVIISISYLLYTITDGAVRMIVLLHAYNKGFTAMQVAVMFTLYEVAGVITNLLAGILGAKWGIRWTLLAGLSLQLVGLGALYGWQDDWSKATAIVYVTVAQMLCGIAKDLTKLGGKTVTKLITPDDKQSRLFMLVSLITGWKNSLKGVGYFLGAACLSVDDDWGYEFALGVLVFLILCAFPWALFGLDKSLGTAKSGSVTLRQALFTGNYNLNVLSLARMFLFGSRDLWFEVPLPFFLRSSADSGGLGLERTLVGTFLALYIVVYGQMQSYTPQLVITPLGQDPPNKYTGALWGFLIVPVTVYLGAFIQRSPMFDEGSDDQEGQLAVMISGIAAFAIVFAINSSVHSYLVVRYADGDKVSQSVGFYYMSNAMGRLVGTLASGAIYTHAGDDAHQRFAACFWASSCFSFLAGLIALFIRDDHNGLACGPFVCVGATPVEEVLEEKVVDGVNEAEEVKEAGKVVVQVVAKSGGSKEDATPAALMPHTPRTNAPVGRHEIHNLESLNGMDMHGKCVLVRLDLNAPICKNPNTGATEVSDNSRIRASVPTLKYLADKKAKIVVASHFGRPKGKRNMDFSLKPVADNLAKLLKAEDIPFVGLAEDCIGQPVKDAVATLQPGEVLLLENTRFHKEEETGDPAFAAKLAAPFDMFVNDAFGTAHRAHASVVGVSKHLCPCVAGFTMQREIGFLRDNLEIMPRPAALVIGGSKVKDKLGLLNHMVNKFDLVIIGGKMAYTFLAAKNVQVGGSHVETDMVDTAREFLHRDGVNILLPVDVVLATIQPVEPVEPAEPAKPAEPAEPAESADAPAGKTSKMANLAHDNPASWHVRLRKVAYEKLTVDCCGPEAPCIPQNHYGVDIGPESVELFVKKLQGFRTVVWNGPMGVFENPTFAEGTHKVAQAVADLTDQGAITVVAGGDTGAAAEAAGVGHRMTHMSTGGGAALELLEGKALPGVETLHDCC